MDPMTLLVGEFPRSSLLVAELTSMIVVAVAVTGTALVAWAGDFGRLGRRHGRTRPSEVPVVLFCPQMHRPANIVLAATPARTERLRNASQPVLTVVECEYLSRMGGGCDFACLEGHHVPRA